MILMLSICKITFKLIFFKLFFHVGFFEKNTFVSGKKYILE